MIIKETPEDFVVKEILPQQVSVKSEGPFLLVHITKRGRNSEDVIGDICRALHIQRKYVSYAGNKDRQAVTSQYATFQVRTLGTFRPEFILKKLADIPATTVTIEGYVQEPLATGMLSGNAFTITVRDLDNTELRNAQQLSKQLTTKNRAPTTVPNYFDEQRFSEANADIGRAIVKKDFALAAQTIFGNKNNPVQELRSLPKKTLLLYVHAYQSLLFNQTIEQYLAGVPCKKVEYTHGTFLFPKKQMEQVSIPLVGFGTAIETISDANLKNIVQQVMSHEQITPRDFIIRQIPELTSEGSTRDLLLNIKEFKMTSKKDERHPGKHTATLTFSLPPGSYATIVVKALF
jgi:tRNA pseudouridine13 synthase